MRKLLIVLLCFLAYFPADAGIYGTLKGKVVDEEGKPVIGASIRIVGTPRGTYVKNKDGTFTIVGITAGNHVVLVTAVGLAEYKEKIRIIADGTSEISVILYENAIMTDVVDVVAEKILVDKNEIGSGGVITAEEAMARPTVSLAGVISSTAGVDNGGNGFRIRGSRSDETRISIDGVDITNNMTGGMGVGGNNYRPIPSNMAVAEVQVKTSGGSAEFGDALGGQVNSVLKSGRDDKYEGYVWWRHDMDFLWGSQDQSLSVVRDGTDLIIEDGGEGHKFQGPDRHRVEFQLTGPIPLLDKSTFSITAYNVTEKFRGNYYEIYDPIGTNIGLLPDEGTWQKNITGKFAFNFIPNVTLNLSGIYGMTNYEVAGLGWHYSNDQGILDGKPNGIPERIAKQNVWNEYLVNGLFKITHSLPDMNAFYEIKVSYTENSDETSKRVGWNDPDFFKGFELYYPEDKMEIQNAELIPGRNGVLDNYEVWTKRSSTADGYLVMDLPQRNTITGYYEGSADASGTNNPWALQSWTLTHGNNSGIQFREENSITVSGNYTQVFKTGEFDHNAKAGVEVRSFQIHRHYNGFPWDGNPFFDVYTDKFGGNIYAEGEAKAKTSEPYTPIKANLWFHDQISYKGIIITPGLRFDLLDPQAFYRLPSLTFTSITSDSGFAESTMKFTVSPRLNINYPLTDRSNIRLFYGIVYEVPKFQFMYNGFAKDVLRSGDLLGNPNMDPQRVNQYEVEYNNQLTDDFAFIATVYYKDIYNQLGVRYYPSVPDPFLQYQVSEYGNSRGIEFQLQKNIKNNFGFDINYTFSNVEGTANTATSNANPLLDPFTQNPTFPLATYPLGWDLRHQLNTILTFLWRDNEGPSIGGINLLENTTFNLEGYFRSGFPYTKTDQSGRPISDINSERGPSFWNFDMRFIKGFMMKDLFGDAAGNTKIEFYVDINNLFDRNAPVSYYSATGDPDDNGVSLEREIGTFNTTPIYKEANYGVAESFSPTQYDNYGNRLYNEIGDFDKNGIITQAERYQSYINYIEMTLKQRGNYQIPRTVYLGVMLRF